MPIQETGFTFVLLNSQKKESFKFNLKDENSKLWMEAIIWTLLNSILTVFIDSTTSKNDKT